MNILVVIPARGGSKGIPRKNLRSLAGQPLISYAIKRALAIQDHSTDVVVSSDDDEILSISKKLGAIALSREDILAQDHVTLDPVIFAVYKKMVALNQKDYDLIITMQPTSPLLECRSLKEAINKMIADPKIDTILSVIEDKHLTWSKKNGQFVPNYEKRVNRQALPDNYKETGGFLITRNTVMTENSRIGRNIDLQVIASREGIDIDTYEDWNLCEYLMKRKRILFVVSGYHDIGLGHVYNTLLLASDILNHEVLFLVDNKSQLAFDKIASKNYPVYMQQSEDICDDIVKLKPDCVINDRLDTFEDYIIKLKTEKISVINFEDLGQGSFHADLVINAIYPESKEIENHYYGPNYFLLRDEFLMTAPIQIAENVKTVVISFGGIDPNNYTKKVLESIYDFCTKNHIKIIVVLGPGYKAIDTLSTYNEISLYKNVSYISEIMNQADIIFTSAGRTIYEVASLGIPCIVLAQNEREMTHFFASEDNGFCHLGLGYNVNSTIIMDKFKQLVYGFEIRQKMSRALARTDLRTGRKRVIELINKILERKL